MRRSTLALALLLLVPFAPSGAAEELPTSCTVRGGTCTFRCEAGDVIQARDPNSHTWDVVRIEATCGGASVVCANTECGGGGVALVAATDGEGTCTTSGSDPEGACRALAIGRSCEVVPPYTFCSFYCEEGAPVHLRADAIDITSRGRIARASCGSTIASCELPIGCAADAGPIQRGTVGSCSTDSQWPRPARCASHDLPPPRRALFTRVDGPAIVLLPELPEPCVGDCVDWPETPLDDVPSSTLVDPPPTEVGVEITEYEVPELVWQEHGPYSLAPLPVTICWGGCDAPAGVEGGVDAGASPYVTMGGVRLV